MQYMDTATIGSPSTAKSRKALGRWCVGKRQSVLVLDYKSVWNTAELNKAFTQTDLLSLQTKCSEIH